MSEKEEQDFYKKLGKFITVIEAQYKADCLRNNHEKPCDLNLYFSNTMLHHYKQGNYKISFFKLLKLMKHFEMDIIKFAMELDIYLNMETEGKK